MSLALLFVLTCLGAYRLWRFVSLDDLPPVTWLRDRFELAVAEHHGDDWAGGIACAWCAGWWASCITVGVVWAYRPLPLPLLWFAAVSTVVGIVAMVVEH